MRTFAFSIDAEIMASAMDKTVFGRLIDAPGVCTPEEWEALRRARDSHPYSAPLQVLALLADKANGAALWEKQSLPRVAQYMADPSLLYGLLEAQPKSAVRPQPLKPAKAPTVPLAPAKAETRTQEMDILQEINSYQEVSFKTAPKSVILSNFLEKDGGIVLDENGFEEVSVQELAKKSVQADNSIGTETLAVILEQQGKFEQAVAIYEKLIVKNPEKSSTFALQIAALKARMEEKK